MTYDLPWVNFKVVEEMQGVLEFNTGRMYTEYGQRIRCKFVYGKGIYFDDRDRNIAGFIPMARYYQPEQRTICAFALINYDYGNYQYDGEAVSLWDET